MEYFLVFEAFHLGTDNLGINRIGNRFLGLFRSLSGAEGPVTRLKHLSLKRISAIAEIFLKSRNTQGSDFGGRNRLPYPDLDRHSPLVGQLMDEPHGPETRMDLSENMEKQGVSPVEIDGDNRQAGVLYEFENIVRPWLVLDDHSLDWFLSFIPRSLSLSKGRGAHGSPTLFFLPGRDLARRKEAKGTTGADMPKSRADPRYAFRPSRREIIHGDEPFRKIRNLSQKKGGQDLEVTPFGINYSIENQAVSSSERMVGYCQETAFGRDIRQLIIRDLIRDSEPFQDFL